MVEELPEGSDACWLGDVCECGAITEGVAAICWRCGEPLARPRTTHSAPEQADAEGRERDRGSGELNERRSRL